MGADRAGEATGPQKAKKGTVEGQDWTNVAKTVADGWVRRPDRATNMKEGHL
jgi:hypothetical protein